MQPCVKCVAAFLKLLHWGCVNWRALEEEERTIDHHHYHYHHHHHHHQGRTTTPSLQSLPWKSGQCFGCPGKNVKERND